MNNKYQATDPWTDQRQTRAGLSRMSTQVSTTLVSNLNGLSWDQLIPGPLATGIGVTVNGPGISKLQAV